ncbi:MAG: PDZ domain-containing protein, partial [Myxococcales bacterium]|nr:PDZ domain-containing protein [Myxococcales bacterium]
TLRLAATAALHGTLRGEPPPAFTVTARDHASGAHRSERFAGGRSFVLDELPPGTYELTVASDHGHTRVPQLSLAAGQERTLELELDPRGTLRGTLVDLETGEPLAGLLVVGGAYQGPMRARGDRKHSDAQGRFELPELPLGDVQLHIRPNDAHADYPPAWVTVRFEEPDQELEPIALARGLPLDAEVGALGLTLTEVPLGAPPREHRLTIAAVQAGGPADAAGLQVGDEIVSVDGHDVTGDDRHLYGPLTRVPPGTSLTLGVRGGDEHTLIAGPAER